MALAIVLGAAAYGIARGFMSDSLPPAWRGGEAIRIALDDIRADRCNRPDASTATATLITPQPGEIIGRRPGVPRSTPAADLKVWRVELMSRRIASLGCDGPRQECPSALGGEVTYIISRNGKIISASAEYDGGSEPMSADAR
jgi:hypothetical protein